MDLGLALGPQTGQHECGSGPHVSGPHRAARQALHSPYDGVAALGVDVGAHPAQLGYEPEPAVEEVLRDYGAAGAH